MRRLLIADSSEAFVDNAAAALQDVYEIATCSDGTQVLNFMRVFVPDLLLLDMQLPGIDGLSVLESARAAGFCPIILATTRFINDYVQDALNRLQVHYVIMKPCIISCVKERLADMERRLLCGEEPAYDARAVVNNILLSLGFRTNLSGYRCTVEAILSLYNDPEQAISKGVYPSVVPICGTSAKQVEHAIRLAILDAWRHHDEPVWAAYFPKTKDGKVRRPTNAVFISRIAASIRQRDPLK